MCIKILKTMVQDLNRDNSITHIFIFFFGPGLPLALGTASGAVCEALLFNEGFGVGTPFFFVGTEELFGVETAASTPFGVSATELAGEEGASSIFSSCGNFLRLAFDNLRVSNSDFGVLEAALFDGVAVDGMVLMKWRWRSGDEGNKG